MKKLTLNILIIFLLFISSYQLTDNEKTEIMEREINNAISNITHYCGSVYQDTNLNSEYQNSRCLGYCFEFLHTKLQDTMKIFNIPNSDYSNIAKKLQANWNNRNTLYGILRYDFINQYKREDETKVNNEDETKVNNENEKEKTIKKEINNVISNITHYCGSLYQNTNLNSESQNSRCLGYCYEFLYTKLQETMKIFNIPNSDYTNIVKKLQANWNSENRLYGILRYDFINEYKRVDDLASKIAEEIKYYSLHVHDDCIPEKNILARNHCMIVSLSSYLSTTFSYYSVITVKDISDFVIDFNPDAHYTEIGEKILKKIKEKMDEYKTLRRLNEDEDALYDSIVKVFKYICSIF